MHIEGQTGGLLLVRNGRPDMHVDLLHRDPITMRSFLSLSIECLCKRKNLILAVVIVSEEAKQYGRTDYLPPGVVQKETVYLAESINLHRFFVSHTNPNVLSITKRDVNDPIRQKEILNVYYYSVGFTSLHDSLYPLFSDTLGRSQREIEESSETLACIAEMVSFTLTAIWIGTEDDYEKNSVFHEYVIRSSILEEFPDVKKRNEESIKVERKIFKVCFSFLALLTIISLIIHYLQKKITYFLICSHIGVFAMCSTILAINCII